MVNACSGVGCELEVAASALRGGFTFYTITNYVHVLARADIMRQRWRSGLYGIWEMHAWPRWVRRETVNFTYVVVFRVAQRVNVKR